jgi:sugar lactone lactonase YvrE
MQSPSPRVRRALLLASTLVAAALSACDDDDDVVPTGGTDGRDAALALQLTLPPGNLTISPDGRRFLSLHQNYAPPRPLIEIDAFGREVQFPAGGEEPLPPLVTVLGVRADTGSVLWILDNGNQGKSPSKIVAYDTRAGRVVRTITLAPPVVDTNSWINDLDFDYPRRQLYISDPAGGANAALIVVDLATGTARRVLRGHPSVVATDTTWTVRGKALVRVRPDGRRERPKTGVDGLALDAAREWLYYGALDSRTMYRIRATDLANPALGDAALAARVERYSDKPPSDGIRIDSEGNLYLGDLENNGFGVISASSRAYRELARGDSTAWVDDFEFGGDGALYFLDTQLHLSPPMNAGVDAARRPFGIYRLIPLAPLRLGY